MKKTKIKPVAPVVTLYKVLTADGHSPYITAYAWSLPIDNGDGTWTPGAWHEEPARVLDEGRGLHITPSPSAYWPRRDCIAYECEASGYRENPESDRHIVATRVRLLRPIGRDTAMDISHKWDAEQNARYVKQRQKERLDRAREAFQGNDTSLTSADLRSAAFPMVKGGYETSEVDAAVDRLEDTFAERERDARIAEIGLDVWNAEARELAQEILNRIGRAKGRRFRRANLFTYGYNVVEVDAFANRIHDFFTAGEHLSRSEVRAIVFRPQLGGYDESQVDFLLDELVRVMLAVR